MSHRPDDADRLERTWHMAVMASALLAPLAAVLLPGSNALRQVLVFVFIVFTPGMAIAGRSQALRARGMLSFEMWSAVVPLSFGVGVAGSLLMAYTKVWAPSVMLAVVAAGSALSSWTRMREVRMSTPTEAEVAR